MAKKKILLVGEHPCSFSGNGHMMAELVRHIDREKFDFTVFACTTGVIRDAFSVADYPIIEAGYEQSDHFGSQNLLHVLSGLPDLDAVMFVGIDLWAFRYIHHLLVEAHRKGKWKWISLFPYDQIYLRQDWLNWLKPLDYPLVYSQFGYDMLKDHLPAVRYHRPYLYDADKFFKYTDEDRRIARQKLFFASKKDDFIFGYFGNNQIRKDPQRLINSFFRLKNERKLPRNIILYLHTEMQVDSYHSYNLEQCIRDCNAKQGDVYVSPQGKRYNTSSLVDVYNSVDCYVTASLQEGLNWTIVESFLCGLPVIATATTAHHELLAEGAGLPVPCTDLAYTPVICERGNSWAETRAANVDSLIDSMEKMVVNDNFRELTAAKGILRGREWLAGVSDINELLDEATHKKVHVVANKIKKILFAQHSSAGDVLMSTQCLKGIRERHKGLELVYMTQIQFQDIVKNNPLIDEIIDWYEPALHEYDVVYNPHGAHILPGGFNRLDVTLYSMYPYFCKVKPDEMFIECVKPEVELPEDYVVVHTTGGDPKFRTYPHMDVVLKMLKMNSVQVGGSLDQACHNATLDLRGALSFRETAYVMKNAKAAVVIDSFPSHLAGYLGTPVVVLYGPAPARVTRPRADKGRVINIEPDWLAVCTSLTNCWGSDFPCTKPCINTVNPLTIVNAVRQLLKNREAEEG